MHSQSPPPPEIPKSSRMLTPQALKTAKKELRMLMKTRLAQIPKSALESQSNAAFRALLGLRQYQDAKRISVYLSMPSGEIQTDEIVRHALSVGKDVFVPYLHQNAQWESQSVEAGSAVPRKVMDMVGLRGVGDYEGLERDAWGIPTITEDRLEGRERVLGGLHDSVEERERVNLDLILMPGVAFEVDEGESAILKRLGHGKGFYDYFLHRYQSFYENGKEHSHKDRLALFGLALKEQFLRDAEGPHVPVGPHDSLLDGLIVGDGQIIQGSPT